MPGLPEFYTDPKFAETQEFLAPYGMDILRGDIPDYWAPIGRWGGKELEDILALTQRDVTRGVTEDIARRKVRGARGAGIISRAMGDITKKLRWEDYSRGLKGREFLFGQGRGITEGVRAAGLEFGGQRNIFALKQAELEQAEKARKSAMWSKILSSAIGAAGTVGGMMIGGPFGAAVGGRLGSAAGGGLSETSGFFGPSKAGMLLGKGSAFEDYF